MIITDRNCAPWRSAIVVAYPATTYVISCLYSFLHYPLHLLTEKKEGDWTIMKLGIQKIAHLAYIQIVFLIVGSLLIRSKIILHQTLILPILILRS